MKRRDESHVEAELVQDVKGDRLIIRHMTMWRARDAIEARRKYLNGCKALSSSAGTMFRASRVDGSANIQHERIHKPCDVLY